MDHRLESEDKEKHILKKLIIDTPIQVNLTDRIMERYEQNEMKSKKHAFPNRQWKIWRRVRISTIASLILFFVFVVSSFISPVWAASIKKIPGMMSVFQLAGDLGLKIADEQGLYTHSDASDTHDGLTIAATATVYDGTRLSVGFQSTASALFKEPLQKTMLNPKITIDGNDIQSYSPSHGDELHDVPVIILPSKDDHMAILQFSDLKNQGGRSFPPQFKLSIALNIEGISMPFNFTIPVKMNTQNNLVLTPSLHRKYENSTVKIEKLELTPITTNLTTLIEIPESIDISTIQGKNSLNFTICDEKGKEYKLLFGNGYNASKGHTLVMDWQYEPFESPPKSITIKAFKYVSKENSYSFVQDAQGNLKVEYIPQLTFTVPIPAK